jgi:hypothetical protein
MGVTLFVRVGDEGVEGEGVAAGAVGEVEGGGIGVGGGVEGGYGPVQVFCGAGRG